MRIPMKEIWRNRIVELRSECEFSRPKVAQLHDNEFCFLFLAYWYKNTIPH